MNEKSVAIKEALQFGWETLRDHVEFMLKLFVVFIVISIIPAVISKKLSIVLGTALGLPLYFLNFVWQAIVGMGVLKIFLKLYDRQSVEIADLWSCIPKTVDYVAVKILFMLIVTAGCILLIVPGLIWSIQFYFASYLVVDKGTGAIAALKGSSKITNGAKWDLAAFISVILCLNLVGLLFLGVGLIITLPVSMLASVYVYRKLLEQTEAGVTLS